MTCPVEQKQQQLTSTLITLVDLTPRVTVGRAHLRSVVRRRRRQNDVDVEEVVDADLLGLGHRTAEMLADSRSCFNRCCLKLPEWL